MIFGSAGFFTAQIALPESWSSVGIVELIRILFVVANISFILAAIRFLGIFAQEGKRVAIFFLRIFGEIGLERVEAQSTVLNKFLNGFHDVVDILHMILEFLFDPIGAFVFFEPAQILQLFIIELTLKDRELQVVIILPEEDQAAQDRNGNVVPGGVFFQMNDAVLQIDFVVVFAQYLIGFQIVRRIQNDLFLAEGESFILFAEVSDDLFHDGVCFFHGGDHVVAIGADKALFVEGLKTAAIHQAMAEGATAIFSLGDLVCGGVVVLFAFVAEDPVIAFQKIQAAVQIVAIGQFFSAEVDVVLLSLEGGKPMQIRLNIDQPIPHVFCKRIKEPIENADVFFAVIEEEQTDAVGIVFHQTKVRIGIVKIRIERLDLFLGCFGLPLLIVGERMLQNRADCNATVGVGEGRADEFVKDGRKQQAHPICTIERGF